MRRRIFATGKHGALFNKNSRISLRINLHRCRSVSSFRSGTRRSPPRRKAPYVRATDFKNGQPRSLLLDTRRSFAPVFGRRWPNMSALSPVIIPCVAVESRDTHSDTFCGERATLPRVAKCRTKERERVLLKRSRNIYRPAKRYVMSNNWSVSLFLVARQVFSVS